jgi:hypothetical protein
LEESSSDESYDTALEDSDKSDLEEDFPSQALSPEEKQSLTDTDSIVQSIGHPEIVFDVF